jgi:putative oxidoreductase
MPTTSCAAWHRCATTRPAHERPRRLRRCLLDPAAPCPPGLATWNGSDPAQRFAVYRNNVVVGLVDALADTYPVTQELVGEAFFRAMAREFVRAAPPRSPVLALYGQGFAEFIESFPPAAGLPYLADVARLEMLRVLAWHAADAVPVTHAALATALADPEALPQIGFTLVPALQLLASRHAVVSLWAAHQSEAAALELSGIDTDAAETALICRSISTWRSIAWPPVPPASSPACNSACPSARRPRGARRRPRFRPGGDAGAAARRRRDRRHHHPEEKLMNTAMSSIATPDSAPTPVRLARSVIDLLGRLPDWPLALLGRFAIAGIFWKSGQTKIEGLAIDIVSGEFTFGMPRLSDSVVALFRDEYKLPLVPPELAAPMAAMAEHLFPLLILIGLATRFSALALLVMTATIQFLVYPDAWPTHGVWATVLIYIAARGPGCVSLDHLIARRFG